jgi:predicted alpha/beta hydrolase
MTEKVSLITEDKFTIAGDCYDAGGEKFAILLHMMPATKESWIPFAQKLLAAGYSSIAIDERGHGESTMGGKLDYKTMDPHEQQEKIRDVNAAFTFLETKGATTENTVVIGASIGANLAIQFLHMHSKIPAAIALSPGLDYQGIITKPLVVDLSDGQKLILASSEEDMRSFETNKELHAANPKQTMLLEFEKLGHGTQMTNNRPDLIDELIKQLP